MAEPVAPALGEVVASAEAEVRHWLVEGVGNWNTGEKYRRMKRSALGLAAPTDADERRDRVAAVAVLLPLLGKGDRPVRAAAAVALLTLDCSSTYWIAGLDELLALLDSADESDHDLCGDHLRDFGQRIFWHEPGTPGEADRATCQHVKDLFDAELERRVRDPGRTNVQRYAAVRALASVDGNCRRVGELVDSDDVETAIDGVWGLRFVSDERGLAREILKRALGHAQPWVRANAAQSLISMRSEVAAAKATLEALAQDPDEKVAAWCRDALAALAKSSAKRGGR